MGWWQVVTKVFEILLLRRHLMSDQGGLQEERITQKLVKEPDRLLFGPATLGMTRAELPKLRPVLSSSTSPDSPMS